MARNRHTLLVLLWPHVLSDLELQTYNALATFIGELTADCRRFESSLVFISGNHFLDSLLAPYFMHSKAGARHYVFASCRSVPFQVHALLHFCTCFVCK